MRESNFHGLKGLLLTKNEGPMFPIYDIVRGTQVIYC